MALKIHHGLQPASFDLADWARRFRAAAPGIVLGGWGVTDGEFEAESMGELAAFLTRTAGLSFYIADSEYPQLEGVLHEQRFIGRFRASLPFPFPLAVTPLGSGAVNPNTGEPWILPNDWAAWRAARAAVLPQAYWQDAAEYAVPVTVRHAQLAGFDPRSVHPMVGLYGGKIGPRPTVAQIGEQLRAGGTVGFSLFLLEYATDTELDQIAALVREGKVAQ